MHTATSITAELFRFLIAPMLLIASNLVCSDCSVWIIGAVILSPVLITLIASHSSASFYQVMGQYFYQAMSWSIIVWTNGEWLFTCKLHSPMGSCGLCVDSMYIPYISPGLHISRRRLTIVGIIQVRVKIQNDLSQVTKRLQHIQILFM
jgi:hypothetical protein